MRLDCDRDSSVGIATGDWTVGVRFPTPVQNGPEAHSATCTVDTVSLSRRLSGRGVALTTNLLPHHQGLHGPLKGELCVVYLNESELMRQSVWNPTIHSALVVTACDVGFKLCLNEFEPH